ncbi:MAG: hypothetical protein ACI4S2_15160 [Lachnospiraceae bacterium]
MTRLLYADCLRMLRGKWFWRGLGSMLVISVAFIIMQNTAMDYSVPLSRVIFLPLSFFGVVTAALVSLFTGQDFSDGFIRNKLIAGRCRHHVFFSNLIVSWSACILLYLLTVFFTAAIGSMYFEVDITASQYFQYLFLGIGMCLAYGSIYCTITMLCRNGTTAIVLCMGLSFFLLFLCLHTNQVMVQPEYKGGLPNPAYREGITKILYAILHDLNPSGQVAQLSAMKIFQPIRWLICDFAWILATGVGSVLFRHTDIK